MSDLAKTNARLLAERQNWKTEAERQKNVAEANVAIQLALSEKLNARDAEIARLRDALRDLIEDVDVHDIPDRHKDAILAAKGALITPEEQAEHFGPSSIAPARKEVPDA